MLLSASPVAQQITHKLVRMAFVAQATDKTRNTKIFTPNGATSVFLYGAHLLWDYQGRAALDSCLPRLESSGHFSGSLLVRKREHPRRRCILQKASNFKHATTLLRGKLFVTFPRRSVQTPVRSRLPRRSRRSGRTGRPVHHPHRQTPHPAQSRLRQHPVHRPRHPAHAVRRKADAGRTGWRHGASIWLVPSSRATAAEITLRLPSS